MRPEIAGVYLETGTEANVAFYSSKGYEILGELYPIGVKQWRICLLYTSPAAFGAAADAAGAAGSFETLRSMMSRTHMAETIASAPTRTKFRIVTWSCVNLISIYRIDSAW